MATPPTTFCLSCASSTRCLFFSAGLGEWKCQAQAYFMHVLGTIDELRSRPGCVLCSSVVNALLLDHVRPPHGEADLDAESRGKVVSIKHSITRNGFSSNTPVQLILLDEVSTGIPISVAKRYLIGDMIARRLTPGYYTLDKINPWFVKQWLDNCEKEHGACGMKDAAFGSGGPMEIDLIDVQKGCLVKATTAFRYVALSYVNGRFRGLETTRATRAKLGVEGALPEEQSLSAVALHAMLFTLLIGERYLWVDTLCIVQDDPQNKHEQIARMDEIYMSALVTFVSLGRGADEGLPWIGGGPSRNIPLQISASLGMESPESTTAISTIFRRLRKPMTRTRVRILLNPPVTPQYILPFTTYESRGWTCQERLLSPRIVYFSFWQMYAQCRRTLAEENLNQSTDISDENPLNKFEPATPENEDLNFMYYAQIVANYTRRNLTFKKDILHAFAGISSVLEKKMATPFYYGLPKDSLSQALFWIPSSKTVWRRLGSDENGVSVDYMPSWSWASWEGQIHYLHNLYTLVRPEVYEFRSEVRWVEDEPTPVDESAVPWTGHPTCLHFEALTIRGDIFDYLFAEQVEERVNGDDGDLNTTLDLPILVCTIAYPESLAGETPVEGERASRSGGPVVYDESASEDNHERMIGRAWLTFSCSPLHEIVRNAEHSWVLLAKEKGFETHEGSLTRQPRNFNENLRNSDDTEFENMPWLAQLMLVRWTDDLAERVAVAYVTATAWDAIAEKEGQRRVIRLV